MILEVSIRYFIDRLQMMELLQIKNKGEIVLCNAGKFYLAMGKDAVLLHKILGLKTTCFKEEICKIGFPINSLEKYTELIAQKQYRYIVYYFDQEEEKLEIVMKYKGKYKNQIKDENINCYLCSKSVNKYKKEDKYIKAVKNLYKEEGKFLDE